jgi:chromosome segregation ATPase
MTSLLYSNNPPVSTLVSRVGAVDSAYQQKCNEAQDALDKVKKEVTCLNDKLNELTTECALKDAKIKDLLASEVRTKSFLSVARQGRARSEEFIKASNDEIASLKKSLEDMGAQMNTLKIDKIEAQNEKLKMSRKVRESAIKLKSLTDNENSKTVKELTLRVDVLNKTVSGLAAQNSSLRIALAESKQKKKVDADVEPMTTTARGRISRERRQQSLEDQVKLLEKNLAEEKRKNSTDDSPVPERYEKRIKELENALQLSAGSTSTSNDSQHILLAEQVRSLTSENKSLKQRIDEMNGIKDERAKTVSNAEAQLVKVKAENDVLKRENERLARINHLDLFEEIEDLKYKYNEAVRQINNMTMG